MPKELEGSSKIMEASAILKMVEDAFYNRFIIIDVIVTGNDRKIHIIGGISKGVIGMVLYSKA